MAGLQGAFAVGPVAVNTANLTVLQIQTRDANSRVKILQYEISFDGTNSANAPAAIFIERQTGGTFTNTAVAPKKINDPTGTLETLKTTSSNTMTVAATTTDILHSFTVPVFGGLLIYPLPPGQEDIIPGSATVFLGVRIVTTSTVNAYVTVRFEE